MDNNTIDITEAMKVQEKEAKRVARKLKWKARKEKVKAWWDENKGYVVICAPVVGSIVVKGCQTFNKYHTMKQDERNRDLRCYDASRGHYWELRRKLNNNDWLYINRTMKDGGTLGEALSELRALK